MIGQVLKDRYRIYDKVGSGGFATVYLGRDLKTNAVVAVKVLKQDYTEDPKFVERFRREAEMAQRLRHPNVVQMLDYGVQDDVHYLVMEYIQGKTLAEIIHEHGHLPVDEAVGVASQVCQALDAASQVGVVHRDIKPHNIMVTLRGEVKVMDFGIARMATLATLTQSGMFMGTPRYLSPEMAKGENTDVRSDIYALGIVFYEMLVGKTPFEAESPWAVMRHQIQTPPPAVRSQRPDVPKDVEKIVATALAKNPEQRFQTPAEMLAALHGGQVETPTISAATPTPAPRPSRSRGRAWPVVVGGLVAVLIVSAVLLFAFRPQHTGSDTPTAQSSGIAQAKATTVPVPTQTPKPDNSPTPVPPEPTATYTLPAPTDTALVLVVTATATHTPHPSPTRSATSTPIPTPTLAPRPTSRTVPTTVPTVAQPTVAPNPLPSAQTGRIAFSVTQGGKHVLFSISAAGSDLRWLGDFLRQPSYRQDGEAIVANGEGGGMNDLWVVKPDGSGRTESMGHPDDEHPVWVQGSRRYHVGFDSTRQGDGQYRIYLNDAPIIYGSGAIRGRYPVWLPAEKVAYSGCDYGFGPGSNCGLFQVAMWGGIPLQLSSEPNDIPTGGGASGVLFMRQVEGNWDVHLVAGGGGVPRRLTDHAANDGLATFSPDGKTIAFVSDRSGRWAIWLMGRDGSNQHKLFDLPGDGLGANWTSERICWGPPVAGPPPAPTRPGGELLPAPGISFPIPDDTVSVSKATTIKWSWSRTLADNQGFEVRVWHADDPAPMGVAPPTNDLELTVSLGLTQTYLKHGQGFYYLDVVVVQRDPYRVLSDSAPIRVKADPNK